MWKYDLWTPAIDFVRESLAGGSTLARAVADRRVQHAAFTLLPPGLPSDRVNGLMAGGTGFSQSCWIPFVIDYLKDGRHVVIADSFEARVGDPILASRSPYFTFGSEVYFLTREADDSCVDGLFMSMSSYPSIILLSRTELSINAHQDIAREQLDGLAVAVEYVLVGAYDEESFVCAGCSEPGRSSELLQA